MNRGVRPNSVIFASTGTSTATVNCSVFVERRQGLGKNHVGARFDITRGTIDSSPLALDGVGVGSRHHHEPRIAARIDRCPDPVDHFRAANQLLAGPVAAALGLHLVFDMHACRTGADQFACRPGNRECGAPAGIRVDQQGQCARAGNPAHVIADVIEGRDTQVGQAEGRIGDTGA